MEIIIRVLECDDSCMSKRNRESVIHAICAHVAVRNFFGVWNINCVELRADLESLSTDYLRFVLNCLGGES